MQEYEKLGLFYTTCERDNVHKNILMNNTVNVRVAII